MVLYKNILLVTILCFFVTFGFSQQYTPMTATGYQMKRLKADSTLHIPSFCGVPTLRNSTAKDGAIAMDTCNNKLYKWTNANGWSEIASGGSGTVTSVGTGYGLTGGPVTTNGTISIDSATLSAKYIRINDSSTMLSPYLRSNIAAASYQPIGSYATIAQLATKLNITDTAAMLSPYLKSNIAAATYQPIGSYATTAQLATKLNITDTANKWVNNITRESGKDSIIYYIGNNRYAIKDSVGTGGSSQNGRFGNDTATIVMAKVHNDAGVQLTNGKVVYLGTSGTSSDVPSVRLANNKGDSTSANTFGFVNGTIPVNDTGWIILSGKIEKLNTSAFSNGDIIYLDSISGNWTKSKPVAPYHMVYLGVVVKANAGNGSIFVKCQNGYEMDEIHDVQISGKVNNNIIVYSDTQKIWKNRSIYSVVDTVNTIATKSNVALKLNISDTSSMLSNYAKTSAVNLKVNISDTSSMLTNYAKTSAVNLKVNISDTATMLTPYSRGTGASNRLPFWVDTRTLSSAANYTISSTLSSPYLYVSTTSGTAKANITPTSIFSQKSNDYSGLVIDTTNNLPYLTAYNQTNNRESRLYPTYFSFKNLTSGSTITVNSPTSTSNRTINFQDKSYTIGDSADIAAKVNTSQTSYTMLANNTNGTANMVTQTFQDKGTQTYTGSPTWTGGTAPITMTNAQYHWFQIGNMVTLTISFQYTTSGTSNTAVQIPIPSDVPAPVTPSGLSSTADVLCMANGNFSSTSTGLAATQTVNAQLRGTATGREIHILRTSAGAKYVWAIATFFTN